MANLVLDRVEKFFDETRIIEPLDLEVADGEFAVFVGPSGCGKTTLLRMIAGLESVSAGDIRIAGKTVTTLPPVQRSVSMVFQNYALYPHMTVEENIGFGLMINGVAKAERRDKVLRAARTLQLEPYLARKPRALSGGQRQRVAIGRAIVREPGIFLFDEPLSNLDADLRVQMRLEIARLHQDLGATMIYVTHDQVEAMTLADKIVVLRAGRIEQAGAPIDLYRDPANIFVAGFIGSPKMNFVEGRIVERSGATARVVVPELGPEPFEVRGLKADAGPDTAVTVGFRPEHMRLSEAGGFAARVDLVERLGSVAYAYLVAEGGARLTLEWRDNRELRSGEPLRLALDPDLTLVFDAAGRRI